MSSISDPVRLGAAGLGRAFALTAPALAGSDRVRLVAAAAPRDTSRRAFEAAFGGRTYTDLPALLADEDVEALYISTPHGMHRDHVLAAAAAGKHILVEKPIALTLDDATLMIEAADSAGVHLIVGPSHSFDGPVALAAELINTGVIGRVRMLHALNCTDFLYRPRRADEMRTDLGGGVVYSQAVHQVDIARLLCGGRATEVYARTGGPWDASRPTEGAYSAIITFENGSFASLTYSGHAHFDSDTLMDNIGELGEAKKAPYGITRRKLASVHDEAAAKAERSFASLATCPQAETHEHFGPILVFGDKGDLRLTPHGVEINANSERRFVPAPFRTTRAEVCNALYAAVRLGQPPVQTGRWGRASLEVCAAILTSDSSGKPVPLYHQIGTRP